MSRIYIFGIGSPFGADRIGWLVIDQLRTHFADNPHIVLDALTQPTNIFTHTFEATDRIIFIDAMISDRAPSSVELFTTRQLEGGAPRLSSHGIDLKTTVDLLIGMGFPADRISVCGIEMVSDDGLPGTLDNTVQAACSRVTTFVDQRMASTCIAQ
jgi:hydrogenase maturation protease